MVFAWNVSASRVLWPLYEATDGYPEGFGSWEMLLKEMERRRAKYDAAAEKSKQGRAGQESVKSGELDRNPRPPDVGGPWAAECLTWPRYAHGVFSMAAREGRVC